MRKTKVLFVCLGNICRSPTAEAIMNLLVQKAGLESDYICDSAGTSGYHEGQTADPRSIEHATRRGYDVTSISRPFIYEDFKKFDLIVGMDANNVKDILSLDRNNEYKSKVYLMTDFCKNHKVHGVPDPYYSGPSGFDIVIDILEDSCENLLKHIQAHK